MTDQIKELKRTLELDDPILFLGAGFSLGAKTQNSEDFPSGKVLKEKLITELLKFQKNSHEYLELSEFNLAQVCNYCEEEKSPNHLTDYLINIFQNSLPSTTHEKITEYPWKKIYTTNIDDITENVFAKAGKKLLVQNLKRKSTIELKGKTEYIKLHGCVNNPAEGLTFSVNSYLDTMLMTNDYRFNSLSLDMHSESIIFVGHDYSDFNIDFYLKLYENSGYHSSKGKLFFINPYPNIIFKSKIKSSKAILIEWTADDFFDFVSQTFSKLDNSQNINQLKNLNRYNFENFNIIRDKTLPISKYESNLYFGYEPNWTDIFDEWDFINEEILTSLDNFISYNLTDFKSGIFSIYGKGLGGKSTFLLRIGSELHMKGFEVWQYSGKYFNYFEFYKWIKLNNDRKYFALLYDDASYNYKDISRLINLMPLNQQLVIITTSRFPSHIRSRYNILDVLHHEYYIEPKIDNRYATSIITKLNQKGYLGTLKKYENIDDQIAFVTRKNDLLNVLYEITHGKGFHERLNKGINILLSNDSDEKDTLILLSIFEKLDLPYVPKELLSIFYGSRVKNILQAIEDYIKYNSQGDISLRTGFFLVTIYKVATKPKKIQILKNILLSIAPQLDDSQHNLWNQIEAACIKEKILRKKLNLTTKDIRDMLYEMKQELSGSYNYWIQLGIAEQMSLQFDKALNHFRQAEVLNSTSYMVKNAIGRNYLKQANSLSSYSIAKKHLKREKKYYSI